MAYTTNLLFAAWAATQAALPAAAQSSQNSSYTGCPQGIKNVADSDIYFNSTGSMSFDIGDQQGWHLSYLLRDRRPGSVTWDGFPTVQLLESFISVPEPFVSSARVNETKTCLYIMRGVNETSEAQPGDDASQSCKGVLSDECIELLQKTEGPTEDGECPGTTGTEDECGFIALAGRGTLREYLTGSPIHYVSGLFTDGISRELFQHFLLGRRAAAHRPPRRLPVLRHGARIHDHTGGH